jgi:hypothetical protein
MIKKKHFKLLEDQVKYLEGGKQKFIGIEEQINDFLAGHHRELVDIKFNSVINAEGEIWHSALLIYVIA